MYHEIRETDGFDPEHPSHIDVKQGYDDVLPAPLFVTLESFEQQMTYLCEQNYHTLTLDEIKAFYYGDKPLPERSVLLTFDDCFQSVKLYAYPILKRLGFHAVAFVVTNWLHDEPKVFDSQRSVCLTEKDLYEMSDVFEYANHTDNMHTRTSETASAMMTASDEEFSSDLDRCNSHDIVGGKDVFAYTFGLFCDRNVSLLWQKGFKLAFTSDNGLNDKYTNPLLLKRNAVPYFVEMEEFKQIIGDQ